MAHLLVSVMFATPMLAGSPVLSVAPADAESNIPVVDASNQEAAKVLYEEGRRAYRKGDMSLAIEKFEAAYDLTENPIILYNIGLTYRRLYDESKDVVHLRRAKVVLENFRIEIARDSGLGSPDEVAQALGEVEQLLAIVDGDENAREEEAPAELVSPQPKPEGPEVDEPSPAADPDKARKLKLGGYVSLGLGGALAIAGGVTAGLFISKKKGYESELDESLANAQAEGCTDADMDGICGQYLAEREALTFNININADRAVSAGVGLGAAGLVGIGTGVALLVIAKKKDQESGAQLRVQPMGTRGLALTGRF